MNPSRNHRHLSLSSRARNHRCRGSPPPLPCSRRVHLRRVCGGEIALAGSISLFPPSLPVTARVNRHCRRGPVTSTHAQPPLAVAGARECLGRAPVAGLSLHVPLAKPEGFSRAESTCASEIPDGLVGGSTASCLPSRLVGGRTGLNPAVIPCNRSTMDQWTQPSVVVYGRSMGTPPIRAGAFAKRPLAFFLFKPQFRV